MVHTNFFIKILKQNYSETIVSESDATTPHRSVDGLDGQPKVRKKLWGKSGHL